MRISARPADDDHLYGHGKAESLAGLFQALVIGLSGTFLISEAIHRIREPHPTRSQAIGIASMVIAIAVSIGLVIRLRRVTTMLPLLETILSEFGKHRADELSVRGKVDGADAGWKYVARFRRA